MVGWASTRRRWFDHWLKGIDTGMLAEPRVSFYMPEWRRQNVRDAAVASIRRSSKDVLTPEGAARRLEAHAEGVLRCTAETFALDIEVTLLENDRIIRSRR